MKALIRFISIHNIVHLAWALASRLMVNAGFVFAMVSMYCLISNTPLCWQCFLLIPLILELCCFMVGTQLLGLSARAYLKSQFEQDISELKRSTLVSSILLLCHIVLYFLIR